MESNSTKNDSTVSNDKLSRKAVRSSFWAFMLRGSSFSLTTLRLIILARLLSPSDFGLMAIALLAISMLEAFSQTGFMPALVQKTEDIKEYLDTAWTVTILRGLALTTILFLAAPYIATFFNDPEAESILQVVAFSILLQSSFNIGVVYFQKELQFKKQFAFEISATIIDFIVSVVAAIILRSVWALALGLLAGTLVKCIVSYIIHPYRPWPNIDFLKAKELFSYGKWILGSNVWIFLGAQIDNIVVGRLLGSASLGIYQLAYRVANVPATEVTYVIGRVAFPTYSKIQDQAGTLKAAYFRTMGLTTAISIPAAFGLAALAPEFTTIFLGEQWIPMIQVMQLLAIAALIKSVVSTGSPLFIGSGNPNFEFRMQLVRSLIMLISIYPLTDLLGISGAALCVILSAIGMAAVWYPLTRKITRAPWQNYALSISPPLLGSLIMSACFYFLTFNWDPNQQSFILATSIFIGICIIGGLTYLAVIYLIQSLVRSYDILGDVRLVKKSLLTKS